jgi:hypothetical protein
MILNEPVTNIMLKNILVLPVTTTVEFAISQTEAGQIIVIIGSGNRPIGLFTPGKLEQLTEKTRSLVVYQEEFSWPTLTNDNTPIQIALEGMLFDKAIRWYIVQDKENHVVGVIPPEILFKVYLETQYPAKTHLESATNIFQLHGDHLSSKSKVCYLCLSNPNHPHRVSPEMVMKRIALKPFCPEHDTVMIAENPCQERHNNGY